MSALRLHKSEPGGPSDPDRAQHQSGVQSQTESTPQSVEPSLSSNSAKSWLDVLETLLPLSDAERKGIRDELASHLRERVRDLTLSGTNEHDAVRIAIAELGDAADLAKSYSHVKSLWPRWARSNTMKVTLASVLVVSLVVGGFALRGIGQQQQAEQSLQQAQSAYKTALADVLQNSDKAWWDAHAANNNAAQSASSPLFAGRLRLETPATPADQFPDITVDFGQDMTWRKLMDAIAKASNMGMVTNFNVIESELGISGDSTIGMDIHGMKLQAAIQMLNQDIIRVTDNKLAIRVHDNTIEVATERYFDERESETRTYSLDALVRQHIEKSAPASPSRLQAEERVGEQVVGILQDMVNPTMWVSNGGTLSSMRQFGSKLFITAPQRHFKSIEWVLTEIGAFDTSHAGASPRSTPSPFAAMPTVAIHRYDLKFAKASIVRDALGQLFNAADSLKQCNVERVMGVDDSDNTLEVTATTDQIIVINKVIELIDKDNPKDYTRSQEVFHATLSNTDAKGMVQVIGRILNAVPSLKECNVARSIYAGEQQNTITVVSTGDQGPRIISIIEGIDKAVGEQVASAAAR